MGLTWRRQIAPIVAGALAEGRAAGLAGKDLARHVRAARPGWTRTASWMAKVWRSEFNAQVKGVRRPTIGPRKKAADDPRQGTLFG